MKTKFLLIAYLTVLFAFSTASLADGYGIPVRDANNIVIASYNIKWFGQTAHDLDKLALVISNFDICGIVEVKAESEVAKLVEAIESKTGEDWGFVYGIRTHRPDVRNPKITNRYHEAYAVVWRRGRAQLGDGVISNIWDVEEAYRNDPFVVSFKSGNFDFILFLVHTRWSDDTDGQRRQEVLMLAEHINWLRSFLPEKDIILAGDFNYDGEDSTMKAMARAAGMKRIDSNAKSTFKNDGTGYASSYDHIYINESYTTEFAGQSAVLDATMFVYDSNSVESMLKSKSELSDHLPVWAVFNTTAPDDD